MYGRELWEAEPESLSHVVIEDFERFRTAEALDLCRQAYKTLKDGGFLELSALNWTWCFQHYQACGVDDALANAIFGPGRLMVWDEPNLAMLLFKVGFYKLWTGNIPELPEWMFHVKAMKFRTAAALPTSV